MFSITAIERNMLKKYRSTVEKTEKGQSLVELALSLLILVLLLAGIVDVSREIFTRFAMQDAAEEGIIFGTSFPTDCDGIVHRVENNLSNVAFQGGMTINVTIERNNGTFAACNVIPFAEVYAGKVIRVDVTKDFDVTMPLIGTFIGQTVPLHVSTNGIILRPQPPTP
jgi:hypothetical protein